MVQDTSSSLNIRLKHLDEKIAVLSNKKKSTDTSNINIDLKVEKAVTEQCLRICKDACSYIKSLAEQDEYPKSQPHPESLNINQSPSKAQLIPHSTLAEIRYSLPQTIGHIQERLQSLAIDGTSKSDREYLQIQVESETLKQCLELCKNASKQIMSQDPNNVKAILSNNDNEQLVISTVSDLLDVRKSWGASRSVQIIGSISDETASKAFADFSSKARKGLLKSFAVSDTTSSETLYPLHSDTEGSTHPSTLSYNFRNRDQEPANHSTMTFFDYKKPESQDAAEDLKDDIQSVSSIPDDIGSRPESVSNISTFHHAAITFLVNTLTSNHELATLYKEATQKTQQAKFIANHRRLLKQYFLKLREDGQEFAQKSAVEILRTRHLRTLISQEIWNLIVLSESEERKVLVRSMDQGQHQLVMLDRFLRETGPLCEAENMDSTLDSPQSDSSSDEDEFEKTGNILTHLEAAKGFFVSGQPFQTYKESLRQFLKPTPSLPAASRHMDTSLLERRPTQPLATSAHGNLKQQFGVAPDSSHTTQKTSVNIKTGTKNEDETRGSSQIQDSSSAAQKAPHPTAQRGKDATSFRIFTKIRNFLAYIGLRKEDITPGYYRVTWRNVIAQIHLHLSSQHSSMTNLS